MDAKRIEGQLRFLIEIDKMKTVLRQTLLADGSHRENDAEHSWHLALYAMILQEYAAGEIDIDRVVQMVLVHDLIEVYAGDTFCYDAAANTDKAEREDAAAKKLFSMLEPDQGAYYEALWREFDAEETDDSRYAAAMDRIQPLMNNYMTGGHTWKLGDIHSSDVYRRMAPIQVGAPKLWPVIEYIVEDCIQKGYLPR